MTRYIPMSRLRRYLLYTGPAIYIEKDIDRLVKEIELFAYRQGYAAACSEQTQTVRPDSEELRRSLDAKDQIRAYLGGISSATSIDAQVSQSELSAATRATYTSRIVAADG